MLERVAYFIAGLLLASLICSFAHEAAAHHAVTGWVYDYDCCSEDDCFHALPGEVTLSLYGDAWHIHMDRAPYFDGYVDLYDERIRPSQDSMFHLCLNEYLVDYTPRAALICLYVPDPQT